MSNYITGNLPQKGKEIRAYDSGFSDDDVEYARLNGTLMDKEYFRNLATLATLVGGPGMALKIAIMDHDTIVETYGDDIVMVGYRDYINKPNNSFSRAITGSVLYQQAINEVIRRTVESGIRNQKVEYTAHINHDSIFTKILNLSSFVSAGTYSTNIDVMIDDIGIHIDTYMTDNFNFERGAGGISVAKKENDKAALSMQAGILQPYKWHLYNHLDY